MGKVLVIGAGVALSLVVLAAAALLLYRAQRQAQVAREIEIRAPPGVQEALYLRLGGIDQWVQIRGEDRRNPVILVLHGGMAMSYVSFTPAFRGWEKRFTVVQWDRRGVGKTFGRNGDAGSGEMSLDRIAQDGIELAELLRARLGKRKIILLGHSMGSQIGVMMAARRPDLFHAYVASEQIVAMAGNEAVSYRLIGERLRVRGESKALARHARIGPPPYRDVMTWGAKQSLAETADPAYGRAIGRDVRQMLLTSPAYSLRDLVDFLRGNQFCGSRLYGQWMAFDARQLGTRFELPIVVIQGRDDVMAPASEVQAWLASLQAPRTDLVLLDAGHLSMMTEPRAFLEALEGHVRPLGLEDATPP